MVTELTISELNIKLKERLQRSFFMKYKFYILIILFSGFISACEKADVEQVMVERGHEYQPLQTGFYWVYEVKETVYTIFETTNNDYLLKSIIVDSLMREGEVTYIVNNFMIN